MLTNWVRESTVLPPRTATLRVVRASADVRIWSVRPWPLRQLFTVISWMSASFPLTERQETIMKAFTTLEGLVLPLDRANVDTDYIIPKQFLKSIKRTGFGKNLFDEARYLDKGQPDQDCTGRPLNPEFALNQARYQGASVLLTRKNFGCGSSREHAPWALDDYGFR